MKKLWNYALVFALLAAFSFSLFGCNGQDDSSHKRELAEHIAREAELEADCAEKDLEIARLQSERDARIEELEARIEDLEAALEEEQAKDKQYTYTFEEAYEQGKITRSDLMHFSYYKYGKVYQGDPQRPHDPWTELPFEPTEEQGEMDTVTAQRIALAYLLENYEPRTGYNSSTGQMEIRAKIEDMHVDNWFLTEKGYYIAEITCDVPYADIVKWVIVENLFFSHNPNQFMYVVKF